MPVANPGRPLRTPLSQDLFPLTRPACQLLVCDLWTHPGTGPTRGGQGESKERGRALQLVGSRFNNQGTYCIQGLSWVTVGQPLLTRQNLKRLCR